MVAKKQMSTGSKVAAWLGGSGILIIVAFLASGGKVLETVFSQADRQKEQDAQHDADVADAVTKELEWQDVKQQAHDAWRFSRCWPRGACPETNQLPVDDTQNDRLDGLELDRDKKIDFIKRHCLDHLKNGQEWYDCAQL